MGKIKLIATDLDGTLLHSDKTVSDYTIRVLQEAAKRGIHIVVATGRAIAGVEALVEKLGCVRYLVLSNGAVVYDWKEEKELDICPLKKETALELLQEGEAPGVNADIMMEGVCKTTDRIYDFIEKMDADRHTKELMLMLRRPVPNLKEYVLTSDAEVEKVNLLFHDPKKREEVWERLKQRKDLIVTSSLGVNLEINDAKATKGNGLRALGDRLSIAMEEMMAFGDSGNDYSMIKAAGMGVAVKNAEPQIKKAARVIGDSNDEDGVARMVEKMCLEVEK